MTTEQNDHAGGHTPLTPPPASVPPQPTASVPPQGESAADRGRSSGRTAIVVVTAVVGGFALLGAGGTAAFAAGGDLFHANRGTTAGGFAGEGDVKTLDVEGVTELDLDADASSVRVQFGDVDEAELEVTSDSGRSWTLERDGDELVVRRPDSPFNWFPNWFGDDERVVLTLPEELSGINADLTLDAGSLDVSGEFGRLDLNLSAGALDVEGSATSVGIDMSAGQADVLLDGVDEAELGISAGKLRVEFTGTAPTTTRVDASAGSVELTLPDVAYRITQEVDAGSLDATVEQTDSARRTIDVTLSAGGVNIRPGS